MPRTKHKSITSYEANMPKRSPVLYSFGLLWWQYTAHQKTPIWGRVEHGVNACIQVLLLGLYGINRIIYSSKPQCNARARWHPPPNHIDGVPWLYMSIKEKNDSRSFMSFSQQSPLMHFETKQTQQSWYTHPPPSYYPYEGDFKRSADSSTICHIFITKMVSVLMRKRHQAKMVGCVVPPSRSILNKFFV